MTLKSKLCGFSDLKTLDYAINHPYAPSLIGFIVNFPKSRRYVENDKLKNLLEIDKKKTQFVGLLVKPTFEELEIIKNLPLDYYKIYDFNFNEIEAIKTNYNKKIISKTIEKKRT